MLLFELDRATKRYASGRRALDAITLRTPTGAVGLLGPNGAGKSTLIKCLLGLIPFDEGSARVLGVEVPAGALSVRRRVGYMPENDSYLPYMSAIAYVAYAGELVGMPRRAAFGRAHEVLYYVGLEEARYRKLGGFSTGMKQRVKLAQALVHGPELVFLDEPTNGLDPPGRDEILGLIEQVSDAGISVVLSSHLLADVERVCDHAIVLADGELLWDGAIAEMGAGAEPAVELGARGPLEPLAHALAQAGFASTRRGDRLRVEGAGEAEIGRLFAIAREADVQLRHVVPAALTLEAAFLRVLERPARGAP